MLTAPSPAPRLLDNDTPPQRLLVNEAPYLGGVSCKGGLDANFHLHPQLD
jgi:hypothetical protein